MESFTMEGAALEQIAIHWIAFTPTDEILEQAEEGRASALDYVMEAGKMHGLREIIVREGSILEPGKPAQPFYRVWVRWEGEGDKADWVNIPKGARIVIDLGRRTIMVGEANVYVMAQAGLPALPERPAGEEWGRRAKVVYVPEGEPKPPAPKAKPSPALLQRMDMLEKKLQRYAETADMLEETLMEGDAPSVTEFERLMKRVAATEDFLKGMDYRLKSLFLTLEKERNGLVKRIESLDGFEEGLNERFENVYRALSKAHDRHSTLERRVGPLEDRILSGERAQADFDAKAQSWAEEAQERITSWEEVVKDNAARLDTLSSDVSTLWDDLEYQNDACKDRLGQAERYTDAAWKNLANSTDRAINRLAGRLESKLEALGKRLETVEAREETLFSHLASHGEKLHATEAILELHRLQVHRLTQREEEAKASPVTATASKGSGISGLNVVNGYFYFDNPYVLWAPDSVTPLEVRLEDGSEWRTPTAREAELLRELAKEVRWGSNVEGEAALGALLQAKAEEEGSAEEASSEADL